ncbi:hypothetical protein ACOSP7_008505 [Xanthoceras sorbifolium]|uniref:RRM domain-containing protein n=1 Tax=Xanthoceras sorbifolium TaxID=99658 RepID=A0ABQ8ICS9_9ROSI|nr:hypothetical protein JRO89_XS03G0292400 [Xanthoceras sorbifolium]
MADHYYRYDASTDRASVGRPSFPGYFTSEETMLPFRQPLGTTHLQNASSDFPQREINPVQPGGYGLDDAAGIRAHPELGNAEVVGGTSVKGYSPSLPDPNLIGRRQDVALGISQAMPVKINEIPSSVRNVDGSSVIKGESNILFVDGLPTDCTRREVGHLFRPFIGYRDIKVVHREPRRSGDRAMVLCFVVFVDSKCALTAMEALQGYKFDDRKPDSPALRIQFAQFPFRLPSDGDEHENGIPH